MNLTEKLTFIIKNSNCFIDLVTASPQANGFYHGGRVKGLIPYLYRIYELKLLKNLKNSKIQVMEYTKGEWTFHAKGLWLFENNEEKPSLTIIGSSNFSNRSYHKDSEIQFYLYSLCPKMKEKLYHENSKILIDCQKVTEEDLKSDKDVKINWKHKILYYFMNKFL